MCEKAAGKLLCQPLWGWLNRLAGWLAVSHPLTHSRSELSSIRKRMFSHDCKCAHTRTDAKRAHDMRCDKVERNGNYCVRSNNTSAATHEALLSPAMSKYACGFTHPNENDCKLWAGQCCFWVQIDAKRAHDSPAAAAAAPVTHVRQPATQRVGVCVCIFTHNNRHKQHTAARVIRGHRVCVCMYRASTEKHMRIRT